MASTFPVKRGTRAEPVRTNDLYEPAELSQGHRKFAIRRNAHAAWLAFLFWRLERRRRNSLQPQAGAVSGLPFGIQQWLERGICTRLRLRLQQWHYRDPTSGWTFTIYDQSRQVPARAPHGHCLEPLRKKHSDSRWIRDV